MTRVAAMAQLWKKLPSEILHIQDDYTAYCIDEAVFVFTLLQQTEEQEAQERLAPDFLDRLTGMGGITVEKG